MLNKITKKEGIKLLVENPSVFIGSYFNNNLNFIHELINKGKKDGSFNSFLNKATVREVVKVQTNAIQFSVNNSWLGFNGFNKCYIENGTLYLQNKDDTHITVYQIK